MSPEMVIKIAEQSIFTILMITGPLLLLALGVGLLVSIFQATTQIQEQTLAFVPKIVAVLLSLVFFGRWMLTLMLDFTNQIFQNLHRFVG
jgi:flagellar biosynthetic protein FliQ